MGTGLGIFKKENKNQAALLVKNASQKQQHEKYEKTKQSLPTALFLAMNQSLTITHSAGSAGTLAAYSNLHNNKCSNTEEDQHFLQNGFSSEKNCNK